MAGRKRIIANSPKQKGIKKSSIMMIGMLIVIIAFFAVNFINGKKQADLEKAAGSVGRMSEVEKLLAKDIVGTYPGTPKEVVKLYNRIMKCLYNDKMTDDQISELCEQMRVLFDQELLDNNPKAEHLESLKSDIEEFKKLKKSITNSVVQKTSDVEQSTIKGQEYATILSSYLVKKKKGYEKTYEKFMLRQDEEKRWKILGFSLVEEEEIEE